MLVARIQKFLKNFQHKKKCLTKQKSENDQNDMKGNYCFFHSLLKFHPYFHPIEPLSCSFYPSFYPFLP